MGGRHIAGMGLVCYLKWLSSYEFVQRVVYAREGVPECHLFVMVEVMGKFVSGDWEGYQ